MIIVYFPCLRWILVWLGNDLSSWNETLLVQVAMSKHLSPLSYKCFSWRKSLLPRLHLVIEGSLRKLKISPSSNRKQYYLNWAEVSQINFTHQFHQFMEGSFICYMLIRSIHYLRNCFWLKKYIKYKSKCSTFLILYYVGRNRKIKAQ